MSVFRTLLSQLQSKNLPSEYQEVEWIESHGTEYINTGIYINNSTNFDIDYAITEAVQYGAILGLEYQYHPSVYYFGIVLDGNINRNYIHVGNNETIFNNTYAQLNLKTNAKYTSNNKTVVVTNTNGTITQVHSYSNISTSSYPIYLYAIDRNGNPADISKAKIYHVVISDENGIVGDFIPCYRKSDEEGGMYDFVTNQFFTNQGSGAFTFEKPPEPEPPYTALQYIESTGSQYIDTGFASTINTRVVIDYQYTNNTVNGKTRIFGSRKDWYLNGMYAGTSSNNMSASYWYLVGNILNDRWHSASAYSDRNRHTLDLSKYGAKLDGTTIWIPDDVVSSYPAFSTMLLFGAKEGSGGSIPVIYTGIVRIYSCKIYDNDVLVRDFAPALDENNVACMYEKISGEYYYNLGSGTFVYE